MTAAKHTSRKPGKTPSKPEVPTKRVSWIGWVVLLGPLSIVGFLLIFSESIPYLQKQASHEAENSARTVCEAAEEDINSGNYQQAYSRLMYALQIKPDYADAYIKLGKIYYLSGDISSAIQYLQKALALNPLEKDLVLNNLGLLYARKGDFQTALSMFQRALSTGIRSDQIYENIGNVYLSSKDYDHAIEAYRGALDNLTTLRSLYLEMLYKVLMDFQGKEGYEKSCDAARAAFERGVTDEELAVYDRAVVSRFSGNKERRTMLESKLARAMELKRKAISSGKQKNPG